MFDQWRKRLVMEMEEDIRRMAEDEVDGMDVELNRLRETSKGLRVGDVREELERNQFYDVVWSRIKETGKNDQEMQQEIHDSLMGIMLNGGKWVPEEEDVQEEPVVEKKGLMAELMEKTLEVTQTSGFDENDEEWIGKLRGVFDTFLDAWIGKRAEEGVWTRVKLLGLVDEVKEELFLEFE
eukprot:TRINITY_DN29886_c0_g1_i1.p1 TRINITY_DN29886_c0_g1~~TRINITY_DN29886_c0_g1_i1.p1  ORF type:complete len:181 (-),score=60.22 TRINITY_DN29886_c0_g1_i1:184-726(-)